jgi:effector-binding domain-containing protein
MGSYVNLAAALGRVWSMVSRQGIVVRMDYAIEHYVNDPRDTPEEKLRTEILIPTV